MTAVVDGDSGEGTARSRELPSQITIPCIQGEMVYLRPASVGDLASMDALDAYVNASGVTGKDRVAERAAVQAWVRRSQAWVDGIESRKSGIGDPESRRTIAWAMLTVPEEHEDETVNEHTATEFIGMIFLIDIDGWARSARIQVILGKEYRGRGYSRDAMPRVMTYGFADEPEGLGLHRIWVAVPEKNTRSYSVYQSLGFVPSGTSRDALWDAENNKYQDLIVMDTLADEYDPIRSLDAFGMHLIEDNPGVKEALSAREHSIAIQQNKPEPEPAQRGEAAGATTSDVQSQAQTPAAAQPVEPQAEHHDDTQKNTRHSLEEESNWPYGQAERKPSKEAWWRTLGRGRKRDTESE